jgi:glutamyl-tRNA synthetase
LRIGQERAVTVAGLVDQAGFLFVDDGDFEMSPDSTYKLFDTDRADEILDVANRHLQSCEWTLDAIDLRPVLDGELGIKMKKAAGVLYTAIEGRHAGLPLFDSIELLGRERAVARLRAAREWLRARTGS